MQINSFEDLTNAVKNNAKKSVVAVVAANDAHTIESVATAKKEGLINAVLIGNEREIKTQLDMQGSNPLDYEIVHAKTTEEALTIGVAYVNEGKANILMKGLLETGDFMRAILKKENNLRKGELLSVVGLYEMEGYHKLLAISDQAINTYPDLIGKKGILENGVALLHSLGIANPKVAVLAAVEKVNPKMKETVDADELKKLNNNGEITGCIVEGPLSFDIATSNEAAQIKGYKGEVAGDADLLIVPDLASGNILVKALTGFAGAITAGTVVGAKVPVVLTPRSADAQDKYYSIALAAFAAQGATQKE